MILLEDTKLDYADVLLTPTNIPSDIKSRNHVDIHRCISPKAKVQTVPIIAANMDHIGTFGMAIALADFSVMTCLIKHYSNKEIKHFLKSHAPIAPYVFVSLGINESDVEKLYDLMDDIEEENLPMPAGICIDAANGHSDSFIKTVQGISVLYRHKLTLMAGNVVTPNLTGILNKYVDLVKVGIGPGSACSTRRETGIGYPQFSAVAECSKYGFVCADGGITCPGDVVKAIAAGAEAVMIGGAFAAHKEGYTHHELVARPDGRVPYYGMASKRAQQIHNGGLANYRASEGREFYIKCRGSIITTITHYLGGLRSGMSYCGWHNINEMQGKGVFVKVNRILNEKYQQHEIK